MTELAAPQDRKPLRWPRIKDTGLEQVVVAGEPIDIVWHDTRPEGWDDTQLGECDGDELEIHLLSTLTPRMQWLVLVHEMWHVLEFKKGWNDGERVSERNAWGIAESRLASLKALHRQSATGLTPADIRRHLETL